MLEIDPDLSLPMQIFSHALAFGVALGSQHELKKCGRAYIYHTDDPLPQWEPVHPEIFERWDKLSNWNELRDHDAVAELSLVTILADEARFRDFCYNDTQLERARCSLEGLSNLEISALCAAKIPEGIEEKKLRESIEEFLWNPIIAENEIEANWEVEVMSERSLLHTARYYYSAAKYELELRKNYQWQRALSKMKTIPVRLYDVDGNPAMKIGTPHDVRVFLYDQRSGWVSAHPAILKHEFCSPMHVNEIKLYHPNPYALMPELYKKQGVDLDRVTYVNETQMVRRPVRNFGEKEVDQMKNNNLTSKSKSDVAESIAFMRCDLWTHPERIAQLGVFDRFVQIEVYDDQEHRTYQQIQCRLCGQKYFYEFYEVIDWKDGDDPQYMTFIPIRGDSDIESLKNCRDVSSSGEFPRLLCDHLKGAEKPRVHWALKG
ncbi:hypothetical protein A7A09_013885 [Paracoccus methylarcula]|uniref:Uncharacterized protein n=1 Tax=Paracoccus methylarcula TaxID=72022 RepID=A0A3R7Q1W4_9RHOB|nr:hypothetical protein A7A09_013885 [Paracoccus methylarcula]